jgi:hypothetical protein
MDDDSDEVGEMQGAAAAGAVAISPSWTWGSTSNVEVVSATPKLGFFGTSQQLAQVSLPEPAVCSLYFQVDVRADKPTSVLRVFNIRFSQGVGRTTVVREISYLNQPAPLAPLEVTLAFTPLHALNVDVTVGADFGTGGGRLDVQISLILTPLTRIPQKEQKLAFGMALPGEADDLDDELREDLESEGPTARDAVLQGRRGHDGSHGDEAVEGEDGEDGEEQPDDGPEVPPWLRQVVDQLTTRYGRKPTRPELVAAVQRLRARRARRARRG